MTETTWTATTIALSKLKPWERNPKRISKTHAARLLDLWQRLGQFQTIAIGPAGEVYDGHQRLSVLKAAHGGKYEVQALQSSRALSEKEREELTVAAHVGTVGQFNWDALSGWDAGDLQSWGFDTETLTNWQTDIGALRTMLDAEQEPTGDDPGAQVDKAAELQAKWQTATGQMWLLDSGNGYEHRLICGDCTDKAVVERVMGEDRADCVFTSPPYAVGVDYGETYQDTIDNLRVMLPKLSRIWLDILRPGGFAVVNFGDIVSASHIVGVDGPCEYPMALEYWPVFRADGWVLWSRRIWCKPGAGTGSMQCISSNRAATNWEHIWTWKKDGPAMFAKQTTGDFPSQNGWIDSTHSEGLEYGLKVHGAGMPPLPAMYSISNHSLTGGIVVEPFTGTGTTLIACERLGRRCRAVEIEPSYIAVCLERWHVMTGQTPVLLDGTDNGK